jgi:hypothetical protein
VARLNNRGEYLFQSGILRNCHDLRTRDHDLPGNSFLEFNNALDHLSFVRIDKASFLAFVYDLLNFQPAPFQPYLVPEPAGKGSLFARLRFVQRWVRPFLATPARPFPPFREGGLWRSRLTALIPIATTR